MKSFIESLSDNSANALSRHKKYFPSGQEISLQVLKGHLLMEELVREIVDSRLAHSAALEGQSGATFNCHQMICLAQAMTPQQHRIPWVWQAAKRLNGIRNKLAHRLDFAAMEREVDELVLYCVSQQPDIEQDRIELGISDSAKFETCVMALSTALVAFRAELPNN